MVSMISTHSSSARQGDYNGTRQDFARMIRALGANTLLGGRHCGASLPQCRHTLLSCSHDNWVQMFGNEEAVTTYDDEAGQPAFQAWRHRCNDGVVLCIGHQHGGAQGRSWVTLEALYFF